MKNKEENHKIVQCNILTSQFQLYQQVIIGEYMPINFYAPSNLISESAESLSQINLPPIVPPPQVHQENVGGTTYFFTNEIGGGHGSGSGMGKSCTLITHLQSISSKTTVEFPTVPICMSTRDDVMF
ncbi:jg24682 [Pararge aegeria aegeria]|uniref:Jg24682 protein n=1 Tax=Pararge aegeria aegeria TaxID=348720 RepID=A0A8S4QXL5_9NEOP|nr:jg24682 [Pararge aegeria aegeria]